jgi:hypothetical protein
VFLLQFRRQGMKKTLEKVNFTIFYLFLFLPPVIRFGNLVANNFFYSRLLWNFRIFTSVIQTIKNALELFDLWILTKTGQKGYPVSIISPHRKTECIHREKAKFQCFENYCFTKMMCVDE